MLFAGRVNSNNLGNEVRVVMGKIKMTASVVSQEALTSDVFSMWIQAEEIASQAKPGQFISVYTKDQSKLLPRPISLCEIDRENGRLRIVYRTVGAGTKEFATYQAGDEIEILGPLGNGFPTDREQGLDAEVIYACGPTPMLRAIKAYAQENGIECWLSLEERMACGVGACLACVCKSKEVDDHSHVHNKRICKDGPVFPAQEVEL